MSLVVQEVLQPQELDSTERAPVTPIHRDLQLSRLHTHTNTHEARHCPDSTAQVSTPECVCVLPDPAPV